MRPTRRDLLAIGLAAATGGFGDRTATSAEPPPAPTRGVVLYPFDLTLTDWPERAARAGLNTIALHAAKRLDVLLEFVESANGQKFLDQCRRLGLAVEYELHAVGELLSRELFHKDPTLFRQDESGRRNPDANCNPFSTAALDLIAEKAVDLAGRLKPTTGRYFYWPDDGARWDFSPRAQGLNASDQALLVENHVLKALRNHVDPRATLSHISYSHTLAAPVEIKPGPGIFLEFAPIGRDFSTSIADRDAQTKRPNPDPPTHGGYLAILEANLKQFGVETAQVLEYWLDVSMFSSWDKPAVKLPWNEAVCRADVAEYRKLGVRNITSFATYIDADYVDRHGDPQTVLDAYGRILGS